MSFRNIVRITMLATVASLTINAHPKPVAPPAAAPTNIEVRLSPSVTSSSDKKITRTLTASSREYDLSKLDETDFAFMKPGTTDAETDLTVVTVDCKKPGCTITVAVAAGFAGKAELHIAAQGKSAELTVKDKATVEAEQAKANASFAAGEVKKLQPQIIAVAGGLERLEGRVKKLEEPKAAVPTGVTIEQATEIAKAEAEKAVKALDPRFVAIETDVKLAFSDLQTVKADQLTLAQILAQVGSSTVVKSVGMLGREKKGPLNEAVATQAFTLQQILEGKAPRQ